MTKTEHTRLWTWRFKVLQRAGESSRNVAQTCRHFGISRQAYYRWKRRFEVHGEAGLDRYYNYHRPHGALDGQTQYERLIAKTRAGSSPAS